MSDFPDRETLIARGKYATVNSERKDALSALRKEMESLMGYTGRILRAVELRTADDTEFAEEQMASAERTLCRARAAMERANGLKHHLDELRHPLGSLEAAT